MEYRKICVICPIDGEVAKGNLTVQVEAQGRDEFRELAASATNMIKNNKKLVQKVNYATGQLEVSAGEVRDVSEEISGYSMNITQAIDGSMKECQNSRTCAGMCRTDEFIVGRNAGSKQSS